MFPGACELLAPRRSCAPIVSGAVIGPILVGPSKRVHMAITVLEVHQAASRCTLQFEGMEHGRSVMLISKVCSLPALSSFQTPWPR